MTEQGLNLSGYWSDRVHHLPLRVYYADTDAAGLVYHGTYLDYAERARTEMLRLVGLGPDWPPKGDSLAFVVRACEIDYRRSAVLDDLLTVRTTLVSLSGASFLIEQDVCRDGLVLVRLKLTLVCIREVGHATRIPGPLRERMNNLLRQDE
jgi:acyl-CoA thioester hydrolase